MFYLGGGNNYSEKSVITNEARYDKNNITSMVTYYKKETKVRALLLNIETGKGYSEKEIKNAERKLGICFPDEYRELLRTYGWVKIYKHMTMKLDDIINITLESRKFNNKIPRNSFIYETQHNGGTLFYMLAGGPKSGWVYRYVKPIKISMYEGISLGNSIKQEMINDGAKTAAGVIAVGNTLAAAPAATGMTNYDAINNDLQQQQIQQQLRIHQQMYQQSNISRLMKYGHM